MSAAKLSENSPIGIFDSGVGGLTVARSIIDQLPGESILYVGDTARGPYGNCYCLQHCKCRDAARCA